MDRMAAASSQAVPTAAQPWNLDKGRRAGEMGYLPGLDGIRALAVIGVLLYHADVAWMSGGFLGVDVFFVLSGFLITTLIVEEFARRGTVSFSQFYLRRARRLLPALLLMLLVVALLAGFIYTDAASAVRKDAIASIFYVNNWWYIFSDQSYFEFIGRPPFLKHLWSLSIEEQFYLVWPAIVFVLLKFKSARSSGRAAARLVFFTAIGLAVLSTLWMIVLSVGAGYPEAADPSRVYFGTDSHIMGLLVGAALAIVWRPGRLSAVIPAGAKALLTAIGVGALVTVIAFFVFVGEYSPWMYRGGFLLLALVVAVLIAMGTHPAIKLGLVLGMQPWRYIGQRSYGLYLWHWPIFMMLRPNLDTPLSGFANFALRMLVTFGVAELSYRFIEVPIRRGAIGAYWKKWKAATGNVKTVLTVRAGVAIAAVFGASVLAAGLLAAAPDASEASALPADVAAALGMDKGGPTEVTADSKRTRNNGSVTVIGDSVLLGAADSVRSLIKGARIDAAVSRMPGAVRGRVRSLSENGKLADTVVIHTGTNGVIPEDIMRDMLDMLKDRTKVVVVNAAVPRVWEKPNNKVIENVAADYPNVTVVDWHAAADGHPEYFVSDGVHLTTTGEKVFARLIKEATGL